MDITMRSADLTLSDTELHNFIQMLRVVLTWADDNTLLAQAQEWLDQLAPKPKIVEEIFIFEETAFEDMSLPYDLPAKEIAVLPADHVIIEDWQALIHSPAVIYSLYESISVEAISDADHLSETNPTRGFEEEPNSLVPVR